MYNETTTQPELIRDMPIAIRPLARMMQLGVEALQESELLSIVLRSRSLRCTEDVLNRHSLKDLLTMSYEKLAAINGISDAGAAALLAGAELKRRVDNSGDWGLPRVQTVTDIVNLSADIRDKKKEYLLAFFLNARQQLITKEVISIGTLTSSLAHPREIFAPAIGNGKPAAGVILVHNHPSGDPTPSQEDIRLTQRIRQAGIIMGIELQDHVIVAEQGHYSFKSAGVL